jgi:hypothetical protein
VPNGVLISWSSGAQNTQTGEGAVRVHHHMVPSRGHAPVAVPTISQTDTYTDALVLLQAVGLTGTEANAASNTTVPAGESSRSNRPAAPRSLRVHGHRDRVKRAADHPGAQRDR